MLGVQSFFIWKMPSFRAPPPHVCLRLSVSEHCTAPPGTDVHCQQQLQATSQTPRYLLKTLSWAGKAGGTQEKEFSSFLIRTTACGQSGTHRLWFKDTGIQLIKALPSCSFPAPCQTADRCVEVVSPFPLPHTPPILCSRMMGSQWSQGPSMWS